MKNIFKKMLAFCLIFVLVFTLVGGVVGAAETLTATMGKLTGTHKFGYNIPIIFEEYEGATAWGADVAFDASGDAQSVEVKFDDGTPAKTVIGVSNISLANIARELTVTPWVKVGDAKITATPFTAKYIDWLLSKKDVVDAGRAAVIKTINDILDVYASIKGEAVYTGQDYTLDSAPEGEYLALTPYSEGKGEFGFDSTNAIRGNFEDMKVQANLDYKGTSWKSAEDRLGYIYFENFENGADDWTGDGVILAEHEYTLSTALKFTTLNKVASSPAITVEKGKKYKLILEAYGKQSSGNRRFWIRLGSNPSDTSFDHVVSSGYADGQTLKYEHWNAFASTIDVDFTWTCEFTAASNTLHINMKQAADDNNKMYIDNIRLVEVGSEDKSNILINGNFDTYMGVDPAIGGWSFNNANVYGANGNYVQLNDTNGALYQNVKVEKNTKYRLTFNLSGGNVWTNFYFHSVAQPVDGWKNEGNGYGVTTGSIGSDHQGAWKNYTYEIESGNNEWLFISWLACAWPSTRPQIDNIKLEKVVDTNLVVNGSFEDGINGWKYNKDKAWYAMTDSAVATDGERYLYTRDTSTPKIWQWVKVEPNTDYTFSADVFDSEIGWTQVRVNFDTSNNGGEVNEGNTGLVYRNEGTSNAWNHISSKVNSGNNTWVCIYLVEGAGTDGTVKFDNINLIKSSGYTIARSQAQTKAKVYRDADSEVIDLEIGKIKGVYVKEIAFQNLAKQYKIVPYVANDVAVVVGRDIKISYADFLEHALNSNNTTELQKAQAYAICKLYEAVYGEALCANRSANRVINGSFEYGTTGWEVYKHTENHYGGVGTYNASADKTDALVATDGDHVGQIFAYAGALCQNVKVEKNKTYKVSFDHRGGLRTEEGEAKKLWDQFYMTATATPIYDAAGGERITDGMGEPLTWTHYEYEINSGDNEYIYICFYQTTPTSYIVVDELERTFIDNVQLVKVQ